MAPSASSMLSKVLRGEDTSRAQPLPWRQAAGSKVSPSAKPAEISPKGTPTGIRQVITTDDQLQVVQARLAELQATFDQKVRASKEAAYREGETVGRTQASTQVQPMLDQLARSIQDITTLRHKLRAQSEGDLLKLALAIAKKVLHREITADPEALAGLIRVALEKVRVQEIVRVRANAQQQNAIQQLVARISGGAQIQVVADSALPPGGVVVETTRGEFDGSVDVQLKEIEKGLADRLAANG